MDQLSPTQKEQLTGEFIPRLRAALVPMIGMDNLDNSTTSDKQSNNESDYHSEQDDENDEQQQKHDAFATPQPNVYMSSHSVLDLHHGALHPFDTPTPTSHSGHHGDASPLVAPPITPPQQSMYAHFHPHKAYLHRHYHQQHSSTQSVSPMLPPPPMSAGTTPIIAGGNTPIIANMSMSMNSPSTMADALAVPPAASPHFTAIAPIALSTSLHPLNEPHNVPPPLLSSLDNWGPASNSNT